MPALKRRLYQLILRLHPASFRDRFAREMSLDFEDALAAYGFSRLLADATRSLFRQWTAPAFSAYQEQAPVSSHPLLAGHYMPLTDAPLTPFEFLRGSLLFAVLLFMFSLALNARTSRDFRNADAMDGRGLGHATSAISPTEAKASSQGVLPTSVQLEAVVPEWLFTPDAKSSRPAPGMPWRNFLLSCASVSAIIWLTSFLVRRSRTISARVALTAVGLVAVAISTAFVPTRAPAMHAQTSSPPPATKNPPTSPAPLRSTLPPLDAISVKPDNSGGGRSRLLYTVDGVSATNVSVYMLLKEAYHLNDDQIVDAPVWAKTDRFDIEGKVTGPEATLIAGFAHDQQRTFYQQLLTARFGLTSHREARDLPEYALTIGKAGSRLQESKTDPNMQAEKPPVPMFRMRADKDGKKIEASNASLAPFLNLLSNEVGRTVIDRTGLKDHYDFTLSWSPEGLSNLPSPEVQAPIGAPAANPGLFTAIQEQLGLKLEPVKGSIEVLVIDHIEKPSENGTMARRSLIAFSLLAFASLSAEAIRAQLLHANGPLPTFEVATVRRVPPMPPPPPQPAFDLNPRPSAPAKIAPGRGGAQPADRVHVMLPMRMIIAFAYNVPIGFEDRTIVGGPSWLDSETYEIRAKIDEATFAAMQKLSPGRQRDQVQLMEQALLADRFHLKAHFETRMLPGFSLTLAKGGPKLTPAKPGEKTRLAMQGDTITATAITLDQLLHSPFLGSRTILNRTGLTSAYDFTLTYSNRTDAATDAPSTSPALTTAVQQQLGLRLVPIKTPVEVLVIDSIDRPTEN